MTREELEDKMKDLPNPPLRVNLIQQVYDIMNEENERLKKENIEAKRIIKKALAYIPPMNVDSWTKEEDNFIKRAEKFIKKRD